MVPVNCVPDAAEKMKCTLVRSRVVDSPFNSTVKPVLVLLRMRTEFASITGASGGRMMLTDGAGLGSVRFCVAPFVVTLKRVSVTVMFPATLPTEIGLLAGSVKLDCPCGIRIAVCKPLLPAIGDANATPGLTY